MRDIITNPYTWIIVLSIFILLLAILCIVVGRDKRNKGQRGKRVAAVEIGAAQYIGTREKQDDSFDICSNEKGVFAIVADGIGGFMDGDVASRIAVNTYIENYQLSNISDNINYFFNTSAIRANERIRKQFGDKMCGTTVVAAYIKDKKLYYSSIGDSIISVFRSGRLISVNTKQNVESYLEELYMSGKITREQALGSNKNRRLMNYVGHDGFKMTEAMERPVNLRAGDKVLLYSDGVELLTQIEMENILSAKCSVQQMAENIMNTIVYKTAKSKDNSTVIILDIH
ncbi:MAG: protein phosphatase 2C domain-containing protein [Lachnospiraceae bacterium]|nr:protein phosphatase 2C domain-containing protein [Lachnospiraceae bacterium]